MSDETTPPAPPMSPRALQVHAVRAQLHAIVNMCEAALANLAALDAEAEPARPRSPGLTPGLTPPNWFGRVRENAARPDDASQPEVIR